MARIAQPPPAFDPNVLRRLASQLPRQEIHDYVANANKHYYHWDELRRRAPPVGLTPEEGWSVVKLSRLARKSVPLLDSEGKPFSFWLPDEAQQALHLADRAGGSLLAVEPGESDEPTLFDDMRERVLIDTLMEEAIATSQIEGAATTRKVAKEMLRSGRKPRDKSEQMIVNGYRTVRLLRQRIDRPLSIDLLHEIQSSMTVDTLDEPEDAGRFRDASDDVHVIDTRDNEIIFTPPPAESLEQRMAKLIEFANTDARSTEPFMHPLVRASILHFWLAYEHPYVDGNGRTARALFYWSMLKSGYWLFEFLTISRVIHDSAMQYYRSFLYTETDDNDLTYFLMFQFEVTNRSLKELRRRITELQQQQRRMLAIRLAQQLNPRQRALLDHALRNPSQVYTIDSHRRSHGVSIQTARTDLMELARRRLLVEIGGRRPRRFTPAPGLRKRLRIR